ncbi:MAG: class III extradiol dioxygenase subunit B-like domain-containing protein [Patescibacteria group bacterium]
MIVFAAITPHSPLLLPTVGKKQQTKLKKTLAAMKRMAEDLYAAKPDILLVLSPHGQTLPESFSIHVAERYETSFQEFGDFTTKKVFKSDPMLIERLRRHLRSTDTVGHPLTLLTQDHLDYGTAVPLCLLAEHLLSVSVVPMFDSGLALTAHFAFGKSLHEELVRSKKRIAVIASADLSHRLTDKAPGGYSPDGKKFDEGVVHAMKNQDYDSLFGLEPSGAEAKACGLRTIMILLGVLDGVNCSPEILSYEGPFGVGYMSVRYKFV